MPEYFKEFVTEMITTALDLSEVWSRALNGEKPFSSGVILEYGYIDTARVMEALTISYMCTPSSCGALIEINPALFVLSGDEWVNAEDNEDFQPYYEASGFGRIKGRTFKTYVGDRYNSFKYALPTAQLADMIKMVAQEIRAEHNIHIKGNLPRIIETPIKEIEKTIEEVSEFLEKTEEKPLEEIKEEPIKEEPIKESPIVSDKAPVYEASEPENIILCFGRIPEKLSFEKAKCTVYKGWHQEAKDFLTKHKFEKPIILSDKTTLAPVVKLAKRFGVKPKTYNEFQKSIK